MSWISGVRWPRLQVNCTAASNVDPAANADVVNCGTGQQTWFVQSVVARAVRRQSLPRASCCGNDAFEGFPTDLRTASQKLEQLGWMPRDQLSLRRVLGRPSFLPPPKVASPSSCCALRGEPWRSRSPPAPGDGRSGDASASA